MKDDNPFKELLEKALGAQSEAKSHDASGKSLTGDMKPAEIIKVLRTAYAVLEQPVTFKPGDIVRGRREFSSTTMRDWDKPHIVLELLPKPMYMNLDPETCSSSTAARRLDAVVGALVIYNGETNVMRYFADLREWEAFPETKTKTDSSIMADAQTPTVAGSVDHLVDKASDAIAAISHSIAEKAPQAWELAVRGTHAHALAQLTVGGTLFIIFIMALIWSLTMGYFAARIDAKESGSGEVTPIFGVSAILGILVAAASLVFALGNLADSTMWMAIYSPDGALAYQLVQTAVNH